VNDGKIIRIPIPELTEERRRDLVKHVKKMAEEFRVSMRTHRRDAIELLKELHKEKELTDDDLKKQQERVEQLTKEYVEKIDKTLKTKEEEIMAV
jgi:ribosome recycling factor